MLPPFSETNEETSYKRLFVITEKELIRAKPLPFFICMTFNDDTLASAVSDYYER
jgi:hypothetical protein